MFPLGRTLASDLGSLPSRGTSDDADGDNPQPMIEFDGPNH
jgi:hypothetical protein